MLHSCRYFSHVLLLRGCTSCLFRSLSIRTDPTSPYPPPPFDQAHWTNKSNGVNKDSQHVLPPPPPPLLSPGPMLQLHRRGHGRAAHPRQPGRHQRRTGRSGRHGGGLGDEEGTTGGAGGVHPEGLRQRAHGPYGRGGARRPHRRRHGCSKEAGASRAPSADMSALRVQIHVPIAIFWGENS